ncbi:MAG: serine/threonine protein kinase [Actinomycetota bacterium]|nr:serine/threonine protein kinase [Actinomycetota bacterium]
MSVPDAYAATHGERQFGGRYRLVRYIAKGGMAEVWEGYDAVLSRPVAVKILLDHLASDKMVLERFRREAITAARLGHPGVIATYDTGVDHGTAWIVMELVRGRTLRHLMTEKGPLDPVLAVRLAGQITDALAHAHKAGLVHRDVKPGNVLLCDDDSLVPRAKVTDFGIAKATESLGLDLTKTGIVLGTPKYLSPEQVEGMEPDARADLYSLGVVLFEMLTGEPPFSGPTDMATALSHLRDTPPHVSDLRPGVPAELDEIVDGLLVKDRDRRTSSAVALRQQLAAAARHLGAAHARLPNGASAATAQTPVIAGGVGHGTDWGPPATALRGSNPARSELTSDRRDTFGAPRTHVSPTGPATGTRADQATRVEPARRPEPTPAGPGRSAPPRRSRRGPGLVVATLVVIGAIVIGVLVAHARGGGSASPSGTPSAVGRPVAITNATEFLVGGSPDDLKQLSNLYDGDPATLWSTAIYHNSTFGDLYPGLGVALQLRSGSQRLAQLTVTSPSHGWSAQAYVASQLPPAGSALSAWGPAAGSVTNASGNATISLKGRTGSYVMLWLTNLGPVQPSLGAQVKIAEITVS